MGDLAKTAGNLLGMGDDAEKQAIEQQQKIQQEQEAKLQAEKDRQAAIQDQNFIDALRRRKSGISLFGDGGGSSGNNSTLG